MRAESPALLVLVAFMSLARAVEAYAQLLRLSSCLTRQKRLNPTITITSCSELPVLNTEVLHKPGRRGTLSFSESCENTLAKPHCSLRQYSRRLL